MCVICISRPPGKLVLFLRIFPMETVQQRLMNTPVVSQFRNLSCTQGRSPLVCYINNNKLSFHGASPVLSSHGDVRHLWILSVVLPLSSFCCKSYTHHFPSYLELDLEVICKVGGFSNGLNGWEMTSERYMISLKKVICMLNLGKAIIRNDLIIFGNTYKLKIV